MEVSHRQLEEFFLRVAQQLLDLPVGERDAFGFRVRQQHPIHGLLEQGAEGRLALPQRGLGLLALGDVQHGPAQLHHGAIRPAYRLAARNRPTDRAAGADHLEFEIVGHPCLDGPGDDGTQPLPAFWCVELRESLKGRRRRTGVADEDMVHPVRPRDDARSRRPLPTPDPRDALRFL